LSSENSVNKERRMLVVATGAVGAVGALAAISPLFVSMAPSERAKAAGAPVEVDLAKLEPGMLITEAWRGKPVWILHRTDEMLSKLGETAELVSDPDSKLPMQPDYAKNVERSIKPQYLVLVGICTHLGCSPTQKLEAGEASGLGADWSGGFFCPCHGSKFDLAGRVYKGVPAPANLEVPPHQFLSDSRLLIGDDAARS
jgi:ubiquinol-cytochrome c reductase iron-sulfur subunit